MFIELQTAVAGRTFDYEPGTVLDWLPDEEAQRAVDAGHAIALSESEAIRLCRIRCVPMKRHRVRPIEKQMANEPKSTLTERLTSKVRQILRRGRVSG